MKWKKVCNIMPNPGASVIAYSKVDGINYEVYFDFNHLGEGIWQRSGRCNMEGVTHWMELPEGPKK